MRKADEAKRGFNALFGMTKTGPKPSESSVLPSTKTGDVNDKDSRVQQQQQLPQLSQQREVGINDENITMIRDEASKTTTALCRKRTVRSAIIYVDDEEEEEEEELRVAASATQKTANKSIKKVRSNKKNRNRS